MDNQTQEIAPDVWAAFADQFSRDHQGESATLEVIGSDIGDQYAAENLPFVGLSLETKGSDAGALVVMLGTEGADQMERFIAAPKALRVHATEGETVLEIVAEGEPQLLLHLTPVLALPVP